MASLRIEKKANTLGVHTPEGSWEVANTWFNEKVVMIFLRLWREPSGKAKYTFGEIAEALGYADRRNVNNYWRAFVASGREFLPYLLRKRKVGQEVVAAVAAELRSCFWGTLTDFCARTNRRLGRHDLTPANIRAAFEQIPCTVLREEVLAKWEAGQCHPKEEALLEEAMTALATAEPDPPPVVDLWRATGGCASPSPEPEIVQRQQHQAVADLLTPDVPVSSLSPRTRLMVWALNLYYWNVPLSRIGLWLGQGKSTIYGWVIGLALALWPVLHGWLVEQVRGAHLIIDEKWLKIRGRWHYWFVALDQETGLPLLGHLLPSRTHWACRWFLLNLKALGKVPVSIMTDGLAGYARAIGRVFARTKHLRCLFHHQQGVTRWIKEHLSALEPAVVGRIKQQMKRVIQTTDPRTVKRRLDRLKAQDHAQGWGLAPWIEKTRRHLGQLIPALRRNGSPRTTNALERFFRAFQRFYKTRGGFHSVVSAKRELVLFVVVYLFTQQPETGQAPIETILPQACRMPLYRLLNQPFQCGVVALAGQAEKMAAPRHRRAA